MIRDGNMTDRGKYRATLLVSVLALFLSSPISWNYFDLHLFLLTWNDQLTNGLNIYELGNSNYPPLATYLFILLETVARRTVDNPLIARTPLMEINWVRIIARIPLIIGYLLTGRIMYHRWGWVTARYWLFTPPVLLASLLIHIHPIFTSISLLSWTSLIPLQVFFGYQFDLLVVPLTLLALFSLQDDQPYRFGLYLAIGTLIKFYPIILLPLGLMKFGWRRQLKATTVFGILVGTVFAPFLLASPHDFYYQLFGFQSERFPQGLSIFHLPLLTVEYTVSKFPPFLKWLWEVVWLPIYSSIVLLSIWDAEDKDTVYAFGAVLLSFVMFNKIGNLNYMVWFWPFLLIMLVQNKVSAKHATGLVATTTLYSLIVYFPAAIANKPIFIIQKLAWYDAREFLLNSFRGSSYGSMQSTLQMLNNSIGPQAAVIYQHRFTLLSVLIVIHVTLQLLLLMKFTNQLGSRNSLQQVSKEVRNNPVGVIKYIFSETTSE